jgi:hypothetical protein
MPRFTAQVRRYLEQTATIEVDADDRGEAATIARDTLRGGGMLAWADGEHAIFSDITAIENATGETVWEHRR